MLYEPVLRTRVSDSETDPKSRHWSFETVFGTSLNSAAMVQKDPGHHFLLSWF